MTLQFLDMPYMCRNNEDGFKFVHALAECPDLELFGLKSVQIIIGKQEDWWRKLSLLCVGAPMLF